MSDSDPLGLDPPLGSDPVPPVATLDPEPSRPGTGSPISTRPVNRSPSPRLPGRGTHQRSASHGGRQPIPGMPPSVLKKPAHRGHRRVFSHGQIPVEGEGGGKVEFKGHKRSGSKTEFILPPGHEERERKRSASSTNAPVLQRTGSHKSGLGPGLIPGVNRPASNFHRRQASRSDSLAFSFRGHSRQASRTDSIYTLRQTTTNTRRKIFCFRKKTLLDSEPKHRTVRPNHCIPADASVQDHPNHRYLNNYVSTTKYTILSFLPKNLFEQFHRFANLYFLFIVLLNWVPAINAFGKEVSMIPVIFVLAVTAIKDIFEDRRRYVSDKRVNNLTCRVYNAAQSRYMKCLWKDVKVGDVLHLSCDELIPADILVLRSSDEHGICYIDTQNLDGEANLKQREVPRGFVEKQSDFTPGDFRSTLECDMPTTKIYRFHGSIIHPWGERVPVGKDNLLLRECVLKNTSFVEGLVVYAGHESKAMLNNGGPRYKRSKLERQMNLEVIWCVVILVLMCFVGAVGSGIWLGSFDSYVPFLNTLSLSETNPAFEGFLTFWTFVIILQVIIPLSLYVTIEMTKLAQVYLMHQDLQMYDEAKDKPLECRALNIPEELGQIQYLFCDKTGTLTENNMVFKRCAIGGVDYGHQVVDSASKTLGTGRPSFPMPNHMLQEHLASIDIERLLERRDKKPGNLPEAHSVQDFFLLLAVCNTVIVAKHPHHDNMNESGIVAVSQSASSQTRSDHPPPSRLARAHLDEVSEERHVASPSPPQSFMSTTSSTAPLRPIPNLTTPKRPNRLFDYFPPTAKPLSPIAASPETTPTESPFPRPKYLQLPNILQPISKLVSQGSLVSLSKNPSRSATPTQGPGSEFKPIYEAESPDELALVDAAFAYNCRLIKRTPGQVVVSLPGEGIVDFEVLHVLPFDSVRKKMSVIIRHPQSKEIILFTKGADSSILSSIEESSLDSPMVEKTKDELESYAKLGLRVLVMGKRVLSELEYGEWARKHNEAENSLQMRERLLFESYNRIECNLQVLGATGIEDRLQEGVPESIANLRRAGIVVWVLTGDKQETAINIAYSCHLFSNNMDIIKLNAKSRDGAEAIIKRHLDSLKLEQDASPLPDAKDRALVVDGKTLIYILDKRAKLQESFLQLTSFCSSVMCCRATPLQKAYIVRIVKEELKMHTCAIGDGANDVSMIQTADVGVGISGQEGMQAVMASDFAISKFRYIERLILVHGHWNYDRLARMVLYFFYKNADEMMIDDEGWNSVFSLLTIIKAFVFVCFWFQLYCGFSGAVMIDQMYLMLYNLLFTSLPPTIMGIFDQDAPDPVLIARPTLYKQGRLGSVYKPYSFWINMGDALYQSLVIYFVAHWTYADTNVDIWEFGTVICTECLCVQNLHLAIETKSWTIMHWMSIILSFFMYFGFALFYNGICVDCFGSSSPFWVIQHSMGTLHFWVICLLASVLALLPRIFCRTVQNSLFPTDVIKAVMKQDTLLARPHSTLDSKNATTTDLRPGTFQEMSILDP